jgi:FAD/FMN-containing dehydrogenase
MKTAALTAFGHAFHGEIVLPGNAEYDAARIVWNGIIDRRPAMVARCTSPDDVRSAILFAREQDLVIAVRCGGHSVGGFSTCDDGIVIDLSTMHGVQVDPDARVATVLGGSLLQELDAAAQEHGMACPVGVVGHTGVGGLTLGGGMGRLQRHWGYSIDNMLAVDLVTADGERIRASEDENPELFWGMRGAGPNFGVVTSFEFRVHELGPIVTQGTLLFPPERAHQVAARVREWAPTAPDVVMTSYGFAQATPEDGLPPEHTGRPIAYMAATHSGSPDAAEEDLRPLRELGPLVDTIQPRRYLEVQVMADEDMAWGKRFYMKGGFLAELSDGFVHAGLETVAAAPTPGATITLWLQGGAIGRVNPDAMAFTSTGRAAPFWLGVECEWSGAELDEAHIAWGRSTMATLEPFTAAGHYVNDIVETGEDVARSVYGDATYERLRGLKRIYDPENVFRLNQNIAP